MNLFQSDAHLGSFSVDNAVQTVQNSNIWCNEDGTDIFDINGFRISQTPDGLVK